MIDEPSISTKLAISKNKKRARKKTPTRFLLLLIPLDSSVRILILASKNTKNTQNTGKQINKIKI